MQEKTNHVAKLTSCLNFLKLFIFWRNYIQEKDTLRKISKPKVREPHEEQESRRLILRSVILLIVTAPIFIEKILIFKQMMTR